LTESEKKTTPEGEAQKSDDKGESTTGAADTEKLEKQIGFLTRQVEKLTKRLDEKPAGESKPASDDQGKSEDSGMSDVKARLNALERERDVAQALLDNNLAPEDKVFLTGTTADEINAQAAALKEKFKGSGASDDKGESKKTQGQGKPSEKGKKPPALKDEYKTDDDDHYPSSKDEAIKRMEKAKEFLTTEGSEFDE